MPKVQVLHETYADNPNFVLLAMNVGDDNAKMSDWWKEKGYTFTALQDADELAGRYGIKAFPSTIVIGPDGTVIAAAVGSPTQMTSVIDEALAAIK